MIHRETIGQALMAGTVIYTLVSFSEHDRAEPQNCQVDDPEPYEGFALQFQRSRDWLKNRFPNAPFGQETDVSQRKIAQ